MKHIAKCLPLLCVAVNRFTIIRLIYVGFFCCCCYLFCLSFVYLLYLRKPVWKIHGKLDHGKCSCVTGKLALFLWKGQGKRAFGSPNGK